MKKLVTAIFLILLSTVQLFASTFKFTSFTKEERKVLLSIDNEVLINYDENTDLVTIDEELEKELRQKGILKTEDATKSTVCNGGGER